VLQQKGGLLDHNGEKTDFWPLLMCVFLVCVYKLIFVFFHTFSTFNLMTKYKRYEVFSEAYEKKDFQFQVCNREPYHCKPLCW